MSQDADDVAAGIRLLVSGSAQAPRSLPWAQNDDGTSRAPTQALNLAGDMQVLFSEEVKLVTHPNLPEGTFASYLLPSMVLESCRWTWSRFLNRFGEILIRISPTVLESDEAIVAVLAHESHELNGLHDLLPAGSDMTTVDLLNLVSPGIDDNLHCKAWDIADSKVDGLSLDFAHRAKSEGSARRESAPSRSLPKISIVA